VHMGSAVSCAMLRRVLVGVLDRSVDSYIESSYIQSRWWTHLGLLATRRTQHVASPFLPFNSPLPSPPPTHTRAGGSIHAVGMCIALAERYTNRFLDHGSLEGLELLGGAAALRALCRLQLQGDVSVNPGLARPGVSYVWLPGSAQGVASNGHCHHMNGQS
jgi:hypothetical protein